jgi:hypothetical protein
VNLGKVFCPTGEGGGIDPTCSPGGGVGSTPEFKRWFAGSKIVDSSGNPLVVYHGTDQPIETFDPSRSRTGAAFGPGIYLTEDPRNTAWKRGEGHNVMPLYVSAKNPLNIREPLTESAARAFHKIGIAHAKAGEPAPLISMERRFGSISGATKAAGFDALLHYGPGGAKHILVFNSTQLKSKFNRGTFDPDDPNVSKDQKKNYPTVTQ